MEIVEAYHPDRSGWPSGPWDEESDRADFVAEGFSCFIQRNDFGAWCGYVGVPEGHPYFGHGLDDIGDLSVHGGITYTARCQSHLCHVPPEGLPETVWWFGFDCLHGFDLAPGLQALDEQLMGGVELPLLSRGVYRDQEYVTAQTLSLAKQLRAVC